MALSFVDRMNITKANAQCRPHLYKFIKIYPIQNVSQPISMHTLKYTLTEEFPSCKLS